MNKKVMALAVASALAVPAAAFAQASNVQIYGRVNTGWDNYSATGATAGSALDFKNRSRVYDAGSRIGVRGTEDLGNGLRAVFVIENGANVDTGTANGQSGAANSSTGTFATRDSYGGLEGSWGRVSFGRQSIYWVNGPIDQTAANYINSGIPWTSVGTSGRVSAPTARTSNVAAYNSPTWGGFNFTASYAPGSEAAIAGANTDASIWGITLRYSGMIDAQYDWAVNQAVSVAAATTRLKITGQKIGVSWPYAPGSRISLLTAIVKNENGPAIANFTAAGDNVKQSHLSLNWEHTFGNIQALAAWGKLRKATGCTATQGVIAGTSATQNGCDGTDATAYMLALRYNFSKRTGAYISWNRISNSSNQNADYNAAGMSSAGAITMPSASVGADPRIWAVGVMHNF